MERVGPESETRGKRHRDSCSLIGYKRNAGEADQSQQSDAKPETVFGGFSRGLRFRQIIS